MPKLLVNGGKRLSGTIDIQGAKNSGLAVLAASILTDEEVVIRGCPDISDVRHMLAILGELGCDCRYDNGLVYINADVTTTVPSADLCIKLRASAILMGAMLASAKEFTLPYPGGCNIGKRPVNFYIDGLEHMGAVITEKDGMLHGSCEKLTGCTYSFAYPSVGALETMILAAVTAKGITVLNNCAREPEIVDLCECLYLMGADIYGAGTQTIVIHGVDRLGGCTYMLPGDRIAAGTYMTACAITGGNVKINNIIPHRVRALCDILAKSGCHIASDDRNNAITIVCDNIVNCIPYIEAGPYPMFPTDLQPIIMALALYMPGTCVISDKVFEERYGTAYELNRLGAGILIGADGAVVNGKVALNGGVVHARDLRTGAALVIASLGVGETVTITGCGNINRGYEDICRDLRMLGADIIWQEEEGKKE